MRLTKMNNTKIEYRKSEVRTVMKGLSEWEKLLSGISSLTARSTAFIAVLAIVCALGMVLPSIAGAVTAGPNNPSIGANNNSIGTRTWSNTSYAVSSNNQYVSATSLTTSTVSQYLVATGFGFSIPSNSIINGIQVSIERSDGGTSSTRYIRDNSVKIVKAGSVTGTEHADTATNWPSSDAYASYGSTTDLWGTTWTSSDINASNFGVAISAKGSSTSTETARIDHIRITITYTISTPGTIQLSAATYSVNENGGTVMITATRAGGSSGAVGITYATSSGTATSGSDYTSTSGTLSWTSGDVANKTFTVPIINDAAVETNETFNVTLSGPTGGATLGGPGSATVTIVNDDVASYGTIQLSAAAYSVDENVISVTITAKRTNGSSGAVGVSYATSNGTAIADSDYISKSGALSWADGETADKTISVQIINDTILEANETFNVTLSGATGGATLGSPNSAIVTIVPPFPAYAITSCNDCHKTVPLDASGQRGIPPTAVIGSHSVHSSSLGLVCTVCHVDNGSNLSHREGLIKMANKGSGYSKGTSFVQENNPVLGTCNTTNCHGSKSPIWGNNAGTDNNCSICHGMSASTTDGRDTAGDTANTDPQVGAHVAHLNASHNLSAKVACNECHNEPTGATYNEKVIEGVGHNDTALPAEVPLNGTIARSGGSVPAYSASKCSNTWCHGAKLSDGDKPLTWNVPVLSSTDLKSNCNKCHGFPPLQIPDHVGLDVTKSGACAECHDHVNATNDGFVNVTKHIDGKVGVSCIGCHSTTKGKRVAVVGQFSANSHHIQGVTLTNEHCYQCHWEANSDGTINYTYHGGSANSGAAVNLVIYGSGTRPAAYTLGTTAVEYTAGVMDAGTSSKVNVLDTWRQLTTSGSGANRTASFTAGAGASGNRMVIVGIAWEHSTTSGCNPSSITGNYGGQTITTINEANASTNREGQWIGYIGETGIKARSNDTITLTFSGCTPDSTPTISAATYEGVDQSSAPASVIASGTSGSSFSWSSLSVVKDGYAMYNISADGISSFTPPSGYTERYDSATTNFRMTGGDKAITADGTESKTVTGNTSSGRWALVAVSIKPAAGSTGGISRTELLKINQHCLSCHSTQNNSAQPFGDGKTPKQYSWDGTSVSDRYSQTGTTTWGKYSGTNITPKNTQTKAFSAHGNASANQRGWNTSETWPNTSGTIQVLCFDCHNSHGSTVAGTTTSYTSAATNGGLLKDTAANMGGYTMTYKPAAGGSTTDRNAYNAGAGLCFDCHLTANGGTAKPWGYQATFGASQAVMGYMDTQYFGTGTFGRQTRYSYKSTPNMGGHFGASSAMSANASKVIGGLCTPCHDPHGVSTTLSTDQKYGVPLLKGTWLTSHYMEDVATADNQNYTVIGAIGYTGEYEGPTRSQAKADAQAAAMKSYRIDQNTFGPGGNSVMNSTLYSITETDTQFAGLCLSCHQKQNLTNGTTHTWKSKDRVHESVKGWKTANTTKQHFYACSKCHAPHNASLPRLMVSNCLDYKHRSRVTNNANPITSGSYNNRGSGKQPGSYSAKLGEDGNTTVNRTFKCHESNDSTQKWNAKTPWVK
jgi:hypothetical protein